MGHIPRSMTVYLTENQTRSVISGEVVVISGVMLPIPFTGDKALKSGFVKNTYLEAQHIKSLRECRKKEIIIISRVLLKFPLISAESIYEKIGKYILKDFHLNLFIDRSLRFLLDVTEISLILEEFYWIFFKIKDRKNNKKFNYALLNSGFLQQFAAYIQNGKPFTAKRHCIWNLAIQDDVGLLQAYQKFGFNLNWMEFIMECQKRESKKILNYLKADTVLMGSYRISNLNPMIRELAAEKPSKSKDIILTPKKGYTDENEVNSYVTPLSKDIEILDDDATEINFSPPIITPLENVPTKIKVTNRVNVT